MPWVTWRQHPPSPVDTVGVADPVAGGEVRGAGAAVAVAGLVFGVLVLGWARTSALDPFSSEVLGATGVAAAAWFLALFALGAASGAVLRRTLPAMAVTVAIGEDFAMPGGALVTGSGVLDAEGNRLTWADAVTSAAARQVVSRSR